MQQTRASFVLLSILLALMLILQPAQGAHAIAISTTVTPASPDWAFVNDNGTIGDWTAGFVNGPATPPLGTGSINVHLNSSSAGIFFASQKYQGVRLADITSLSYSTYTNLSPAAMTFQFNVDPDLTTTEATWYGRLTYEPYMNGTVTNGTWQTWDMINGGSGKWWASKLPVSANCPQSAPCTLTTLLSLYPNIGIRNDANSAIGFKAGSNWNGFNGNVDNFTFVSGSYNDVYDFELPSTVYVDDDWAGTTPGTDPDGAGPATVFGADSFAVIQDGINAVANNGTVNVFAGSYAGTMNIDGRTGLTILGADAATTILTPSTTLAWNACGSTTARQTVLRVVNSTGITVSNLTIDMDLVKGNSKFAGLYCDSTGTLSGNIFKNNQLPDISGGYYELGLALRAPGYTDTARAPITVSGNTFQDMGRVAINIHNFVDMTITGNTFLKTVDDFGYGIELGSQSTGTITGNTFHGFDTPALSDQSTSAAIYIENAFTSAVATALAKNVTISNNEVYDNQWGVYIGNEFDGYAGNVDILVDLTANNIHDNTDGGVFIADEDMSAGSSVTLTGSGNTVTNNVGYGYYVTTYGDGDVSVSLSGDTITGQDTGLYIEDLGIPSTSVYTVTITDSDLSGNTSYAVSNTVAGFTVDAANNWWGSDFGPSDPTGTIEVPVVPEPSVANMLNAAPAGMLGVGVSEYVDYYPFTSNAPLSFSPDPVTFVNQLLNTTSPSQTVTITNNGALDVTLGTLGISGDFALANDLCSSTTLAPTGTCTFDVTFTPLAVGARAGEVIVNSDAPSSPDSVVLAGNGYVNSILRFRSIGVNDGTVRESSETSGIANFTESTNELINVGDDALKRQFKGILDFNTATLPDGAVITGATLQVRAMIISPNVYTKLGNMTADITNPFFGGSVGMNYTDFTSRAKATKVGTFTRTSTYYRWVTLRVNTASLFAINKTGHTQFRLRFLIDDSNDAIKDELRFLSGNYSVISDRPLLVISFYVP